MQRTFGLTGQSEFFHLVMGRISFVDGHFERTRLYVYGICVLSFLTTTRNYESLQRPPPQSVEIE
jgi:hypothetical protein